jgi:hypothetical protein
MWAECSEKPAHQKKPAPQSALDTHHTAIHNCYLSKNNQSAMESDCTEAANDNRSNNLCLYRDFDDNFATFLAPPPPVRKKVAENVKHGDKPAKKKRKTIAASGSDTKGKDMAYAQSNLAFAKSLEEPLLSLWTANDGTRQWMVFLCF